MVDDGTPIAYTALEQGMPVVARSGNQFGTVERVIEDLGEDILHGIVDLGQGDPAGPVPDPAVPGAPPGGDRPAGRPGDADRAGTG